ncbi:MAG: nickel pincer cofactor biosynthesis protein LarB, partial [Nitrospira sp. SB0678_bin_10]|nr:nickel pincer cofactor biosynthesis protein LarB [Nitrospira sp. SB0678_bin_10]
MHPSVLESLLQSVQDGSTSIAKALEQLRTLPYEDLGFAKLDHHRTLRHGAPEVILCEGKTEKQIVALTRGLLKHKHPVLATRADAAVARALKRVSRRAVYHQAARVVVIQPAAPSPLQGDIVIVTAGTADIPVAEEAKVTAMTLGSAVETIFDVGVAGVHRLFDQVDRLQRARVVIVVAGMDGVLPSVVAGLV